MTRHSLDTPQFYLTAPSPCPYLKGKQERKVFTHLVGEKAIQVNNMLSQGGFRRSQNIAYRPACEGCKACVSTRVIVDEFVHTKSFKRILKSNKNICSYLCPAVPDYDQYDLFRQYLDSRHPEGGMSDMNYIDYAMMVEDSHVDTFMVEYRYRDPDTLTSNKEDDPLVGIALTDVLQNGLSMVYSFFDTDSKYKSLGSYMILDHIKQARRRGLPYIYMGYWVEGSSKMDYKTRFKPQEHLGVSGWRRRN